MKDKKADQLKYDKTYKANQKKAGIKQVRVMVPMRDVETIIQFAARLRARYKIDKERD